MSCLISCELLIPMYRLHIYYSQLVDSCMHAPLLLSKTFPDLVDNLLLANIYIYIYIKTYIIIIIPSFFKYVYGICLQVICMLRVLQFDQLTQILTRRDEVSRVRTATQGHQGQQCRTATGTPGIILQTSETQPQSQIFEHFRQDG